MLTAVHTFSALELCDQGEYRAAAELAGLTVGERPERGSEGILTHAMALLTAGVIQSCIGGIQQTGDQALAREMLTDAADLFGDDPRANVARSWLAWAEYWDGNLDKALAIIDGLYGHPDQKVSENAPLPTTQCEGVGQTSSFLLDPSVRFRTELLRASIYSDRDLPDQAFETLMGVEPLYDSCDSLQKGKFHNQRGRVLRLLGETDRAINDYDAAIEFFRASQNVRCEAASTNNLAGVYLETGQYAQAHDYAERARILWRELGDKTYEAEAWDQTAQTYLAEGKLKEAEASILSGISLVSHGETLRKCLVTLNEIKRVSGIHRTDECDNFRDARLPIPRPPALSRKGGGSVMTPLDCALSLIQNDPDLASTLLDLIVWATGARDEPKHEVELDHIERVVHSFTPECEQERTRDRGRRLVKLVPTSES